MLQRILDDFGGRYIIIDKLNGVWQMLKLPFGGGLFEIVPMDPNALYTIITD